MGQIRSPRPVLLVAAIFSRYDEALAWARARGTAAWGQLVLESPLFEFAETQFYERTMGPGIRKQLVAFAPLIDPERLAAIKRLTNDWEDEFKATHAGSEPRPLNIDPGYLTEAKLILATTKDRDHRIYLAQGIYAEQTLYFQHGAWRPREWTYPDYRRADYHRFFDRCREYLREHLA